MVHIVDFVLGFIFPLWTFTVHLSTVVSTSVEGQPQVIGSSQPIIAALGDDVILPCHLEPQFDVEELTVEWWRPDLPPDPGDPLSQYKYVHRYRDNHDVEDMKMSWYAGRTALVADGLKHGNVSLKIMNVKLLDQGRYRCSIPQLWSASIIKLVVEPKSVKTRITVSPLLPRSLKTADPKKETDIKVQFSRSRLIPVVVACVSLILGAGVCGHLLKQRCQKQHLPKYVTTPVEPPPV